MEIEDVRRAAQRIVEVRGRGFALSSEDREDLLQDVLMRYMTAWSGAAEPDNVDAWLETATRRLITDRWRAERRRPQPERAEDAQDGERDVVADLVERSRSRQASLLPVGDALLAQVFDLVSDQDASLLRRHLFDDVSAAEIAEELGVSRAAVDQRVSRAKTRLQAALTGRPDLVAELRAGHPKIY